MPATGERTAQSALEDLDLVAAVVLDSGASIGDAVAAMASAGVAAVLAGDRVVGEREIVRALAAGADSRTTLDAIATQPAVFVDPATAVGDVAARMVGEQVDHVVIDVVGGRAVVSLRDVAAVLVRAAEPARHEARPSTADATEIWLG